MITVILSHIIKKHTKIVGFCKLIYNTKTSMVTHTFYHLFVFVIFHKTCVEKMKKISTVDLISGYVF